MLVLVCVLVHVCVTCTCTRMSCYSVKVILTFFVDSELISRKCYFLDSYSWNLHIWPKALGDAIDAHLVSFWRASVRIVSKEHDHSYLLLSLTFYTQTRGRRYVCSRIFSWIAYFTRLTISVCLVCMYVYFAHSDMHTRFWSALTTTQCHKYTFHNPSGCIFFLTFLLSADVPPRPWDGQAWDPYLNTLDNDTIADYYLTAVSVL